MVPRDDPCPQRGPGLSHTTSEGKWVCQHCNAVVFIESDPIAKLRRQYLAGETHDEPEERVHPEFAALSAEQWHRAVEVRHRVEHGRLTEWPNAVPLTDTDKAILGRMTDALIGLFRRVS